MITHKSQRATDILPLFGPNRRENHIHASAWVAKPRRSCEGVDLRTAATAADLVPDSALKAEAVVR